MNLQQFYDYLKKEEITPSSLSLQNEHDSYCYQDEKLTEEDRQTLKLWNEELRMKNFLDGEGLSKGEKDDEAWKKVENIVVDSHLLPNLYRWQAMMSKLVK